MKMLTEKTDSGNPLYLHMACDELRLYGMFEQVRIIKG